MANTRKAYRFEVFQANSTVVDFTIDSSGLHAPPTLGGQRVYPLDGRTESVPTVVRVLDPNNTFTERISNAGGRSQLINRRAQVSVRVGSTSQPFQTSYIGRITALDDAVSFYSITLHDERHVERNSQIFTSLDWPSSSNATSTAYYAGTVLSPPGVHGEYRGVRSKYTKSPSYIFPPPPDTEETYGSGGLFAVALSLGPQPDWNALIDILENDIRPDLPASSDAEVANTTEGGNFIHLRALGQNNNLYEVRSISRAVLAGEPDPARLRGDLLSGLQAAAEEAPGISDAPWVHIIAPTSGEADQANPVRLVMPTRPPTQAVPLHIGGIYGIDPWVLTEDIYKEIGVEYASSAFDALYNHWPGYIMGWRIKGPANAARWLEENIYGPFGVVPFVDEQGRVAPRRVFAVDGSFSTAVADLPVFASTDVAEQPTWQQTNELVTALRFTYTQETFKPQGAFTVVERGRGGLLGGTRARLSEIIPTEWETGFPFDLIDEVVADQPTSSGGVWFEHDRINEVGRFEREIHLSGTHNKIPNPSVDSTETIKLLPQSPQSAAKMLAVHTFSRYGDGPIRGTLAPLTSETPGSSGITPGDYIQIAVGTYPDVGEQARSTEGRIVQVLSRVETMGGFRYDVLDVGPALDPLNTLTATVSTSTGDPRHGVQVTISGLATDATWTAQLVSSTGAPSTANDPVWIGTGDATGVTTKVVHQLPSGRDYYVRAQQTAPYRIASAWSTFDGPAQTEALSAPTAIAVDSSGRRATVSWTNGETRYPIALSYAEGTDSSAAELVARINARGDTYELFSLAQDTSHYVEIAHVDVYGGRSPADSTTFTTSTSASQAPDFGTLSLVEGIAV